MSRFATALVLALSATTAHAEDIVAYQAEGDAPASAGDARTMALDEAFATAVSTALSELVAADVRTARKGDIDKELVGRARLWVAKFSVTKDDTVEGRRELTVSVRIDRDKLRARLDELGIASKGVATVPGEAGNGPTLKTVTVLMRVQSPAGLQATYGNEANPELPAAVTLDNLLRAQGYMVRRAPATGSASGELTEQAADGLAAGAQADSYALAEVAVGPALPVRGRPGTASLVTAKVKLVERAAAKVVGQGTGTAAALGDGYAVNRALAFALADVIPPQPATLGQAGTFSGDDTPVAEPGIVLVRLPAQTSMHMVLDEQKLLAGAKGVRGVSLRRMSPAGWVLGVATSESAEQVARIAKRAPATDTMASVKIAGGIVEVALSGSP
jgi:hypothetical protein